MTHSVWQSSCIIQMQPEQPMRNMSSPWKHIWTEKILSMKNKEKRKHTVHPRGFGKPSRKKYVLNVLRPSSPAISCSSVNFSKRINSHSLIRLGFVRTSCNCTIGVSMQRAILSSRWIFMSLTTVTPFSEYTHLCCGKLLSPPT